MISELVITERDFCRDLKLTWQAFGLDTPDMLEQRSVDVPALFGNLGDVIETSASFLEALQKETVSANEDPDVRRIGRCFLQNSEAMKVIYTEYCVNHEKAEQLLERYDSTPEISKLLQRGIETIQTQVACFNMGSILIKPVQRILKYPLILNELIKCTEAGHADKQDLIQARIIMSDVATSINESKRRKDIVDKYRSEGEKTLTRRISKINMHTLNKKSSRLSQRIISSLGMDHMVRKGSVSRRLNVLRCPSSSLQTKDVRFVEHEKKFMDFEIQVKSFTSSSQKFSSLLHDVLVSQFNIGQNFSDVFKQQPPTREVARFKAVHKKILSDLWNDYVSCSTAISSTRNFQKKSKIILSFSFSE